MDTCGTYSTVRERLDTMLFVTGNGEKNASGRRARARRRVSRRFSKERTVKSRMCPGQSLGVSLGARTAVKSAVKWADARTFRLSGGVVRRPRCIYCMWPHRTHAVARAALAHGVTESEVGREIGVPQVPRASTEDHAQEPCRAGDGTDVARSPTSRKAGRTRAGRPVKRVTIVRLSDERH